MSKLWGSAILLVGVLAIALAIYVYGHSNGVDSEHAKMQKKLDVAHSKISTLNSAIEETTKTIEKQKKEKEKMQRNLDESQTRLDDIKKQQKIDERKWQDKLDKLKNKSECYVLKEHICESAMNY